VTRLTNHLITSFWFALRLRISSGNLAGLRLNLKLISSKGFWTFSFWVECPIARVFVLALPSVLVSTSGLWWSLSSVDKRPRDNLHQKNQQQGPGQELACCWLEIFRNQVFFDNDPSSSTSLRSTSRPGESERRCWGRLVLRGMWGSRGPRHTQPRPSCDSEWQDDKCDDDDDRRPSVGPWTGAHQHWGAAILGPRDGAHPVLLQLLSSATRSSLITILLLQPVFFLRSASRPDPSYCMCASGWRK